MDVRKYKEAEFHNLVRGGAAKENKAEYNRLTANKKFYSITRASDAFVHTWIFTNGRSKELLDYCCGSGDRAILFAKKGIRCVGIDISDVSIDIGNKRAKEEGVAENAQFHVIYAEHTIFPDISFDIVSCLGVLHHLDTEKAFLELARIVRPEGAVICDEPLAYNPLFQLYRRMTPHLRTDWEMRHILGKKDIERAKKYFGRVEMRFFHLATLAAVPFRNQPFFNSVLRSLESIDSFLSRIPLICWLSWQVVFILSEPRKDAYGKKDI